MSNKVKNTNKKGSFWYKVWPFIVSVLFLVFGLIISYFWFPFIFATLLGPISFFAIGVMRIKAGKKK